MDLAQHRSVTKWLLAYDARECTGAQVLEGINTMLRTVSLTHFLLSALITSPFYARLPPPLCLVIFVLDDIYASRTALKASATSFPLDADNMSIAG